MSKYKEFLSELTALTKKHGLAIKGCEKGHDCPLIYEEKDKGDYCVVIDGDSSCLFWMKYSDQL